MSEVLTQQIRRWESDSGDCQGLTSKMVNLVPHQAPFLNPKYIWTNIGNVE